MECVGLTLSQAQVALALMMDQLAVPSHRGRELAALIM